MHALDQALDNLDSLWQATARPGSSPASSTPTSSPVSWDRALAFSAEKCFDLKPSAYCVDVRLLARLQQQGVRAALERLRQEYPLGWATCGDATLDLQQALPPHAALRYFIPLVGGPVLRLGASGQSLGHGSQGAV